MERGPRRTAGLSLAVETLQLRRGWCREHTAGAQTQAWLTERLAHRARVPGAHLHGLAGR